MTDKLDSIRSALDEVDRALVEALAKRQRLVEEVARHKAGTEGARLRDVTREEDVLTSLVEAGRDEGLDGYFLTRVFREILDHSLRYQHEFIVDHQNPERRADLLTIAYQGTDGSYSQLAASRHFSARTADAIFKGYDTFEQMLEAVAAGGADYGVLPIENTTAGSINEAYDLLAQMDLAIVGEEIQRVDHCLVALQPVPLSHIRRISSHPQALAQCSQFLTSLEHCHVESFTDTAMAVRKLREDQDLSEAAIASEEAAKLYGLHVIKRDIANQRENYTRMVVVARTAVDHDERIPCKTSLILATRHEEGALLSCLNVLASHHLNLTKLESRPRPHTPWEYLFYVDFEGNVASENTQAALQELSSRTSLLKVLGSYPARNTKDAKPAAPRKKATPPPPATKPAPESTEQSILEMLEKKPYKLASRVTRPEDTTFVVGDVEIGGSKPVIIAGPCSVESKEQIRECARVVRELGGDILRGGCFKPRTSPYSFQGLGYEGLELLAQAGAEFGLPIITEVLHPADVARVAEKADILQVGARNMQNFSLLKEVGKVDRPVMLKRGMMSSIDEWLAAAEYILAHGNQRVFLCERGIRTFETATRNTLDLSAVPVARERTHLPVFVDPSHACGTWRWVAPMTEAAIAVGAQGVMVEVHPKPEEALSDGPQALRFSVFEQLMERLAR